DSIEQFRLLIENLDDALRRQRIAFRFRLAARFFLQSRVRLQSMVGKASVPAGGAGLRVILLAPHCGAAQQRQNESENGSKPDCANFSNRTHGQFLSSSTKRSAGLRRRNCSMQPDKLTTIVCAGLEVQCTNSQTRRPGRRFWYLGG